MTVYDDRVEVAIVKHILSSFDIEGRVTPEAGGYCMIYEVGNDGVPK